MTLGTPIAPPVHLRINTLHHIGMRHHQLLQRNFLLVFLHVLARQNKLIRSCRSINGSVSVLLFNPRNVSVFIVDELGRIPQSSTVHLMVVTALDGPGCNQGIIASLVIAKLRIRNISVTCEENPAAITVCHNYALHLCCNVHQYYFHCNSYLFILFHLITPHHGLQSP